MQVNGTRRDIEVITPLPDGDFAVLGRSLGTTGASLPPGLRIPSGVIVGTTLILTGVHLAPSEQAFEVWTLDLVDMLWSPIHTGSTLSEGSWLRACLWRDANKLLVFGDPTGNSVRDFNHRSPSWNNVVAVDLEAFGVYQPPRLVLEIPQQILGLSALEEGIRTDFEVVCSDGRKIKCSRKPLEDRWVWFKKQRGLYLQAAARAIESTPTASRARSPSSLVREPQKKQAEQADPRLSLRALNLGESYPVTLALLQYMYSMALLTPLQHAPAVISRLLVLSNTYDLPHLRSLVKHALHWALTGDTAPGIYNIASLCGCNGLQLR